MTLRSLIEHGNVVLDLGMPTASFELTSVETAIKFEGYLKRQEAAVDRARRQEDRTIPPGFPFDRVPGLSKEIVQRFEQVRPETLGQAGRIPGATPAAVAVLGSYVQRFPS